MTWEKFWSIIDRVRAKADMQDEASVKQFLYTELINLPQDELLGFDCAWQSYRNKANFPKMVAAACIINDGSSDDRFTDFRNWLIMQGYDAYRQALIDPDNLAALNIPFRDTEWMGCGNVAWYAYAGQKVLPHCSTLEQVIVMGLLNTGMRRGELAGLTWEDIDFDHCTVHVDKSLLIVNKGYHLTTTKEDNVRDIDVAPEFMEYLKTYREQWLAQKHRMGSTWQTCMDGKWESYRESLQKLRGKNFIVINDFGWPISPDHYGKIVDRVAEKAGIRKIHPHMFRHTFVSILLSNPDIGVATVAAEAGHAQPSTTLAIYTQVYHKRQDSIRSQMSETLYKRKTPER